MRFQHPFEPILKVQQAQERELESQRSSDQQEEEEQNAIEQIVTAVRESRDAPPRRKKIKTKATTAPAAKPSPCLTARARMKRQQLWRPLHRRGLREFLAPGSYKIQHPLIG